MAEGNRLGEAASAYLRSARRQPVEWHEWGEAAFAQARQLDRPVLLDVGAVWCHWCHVMDRESYENAETAALINELFVAVKVDRDERPDVDARYQAAVAAISGSGGWPLTAFLTPAGEPYFGGTYFPPEDRYGRPSFRRVLRSMAEAYRGQRAEVLETAASVLTAVEQNESFGGGGVALDARLLETMLAAMLGQFDARNGGFGAQPKFPHPAALDLLIDAAGRPGELAERARTAVAVTLGKMAAGGVHDQLAGGFHRYSVDERWGVPHFEKMAYDNSELLRVYSHAFQSTGDPRLAGVATGTLEWMDAWLSDREQGGFYGSQDADVSLGDDGDYFTWTRAEAEAVLEPAEFELASAFYDLRAVGDMQHNPAKNVLRVAADVGSLSQRFGRSESEVRKLLEAAAAKLYAARLRRPAPFVDRTLYTGWNGLCISAYLAAGRALERLEVTSFALRSLERVLMEAWRPGVGLARVVAYGDGGSVGEPVSAVLEDYAYLAAAALDAWEVTGELRYFRAAEALVEVLLERFWDGVEGGFFDVAVDEAGRIGALRAKRKPLQDAPAPGGNPVVAGLLLRLHGLTGREVYRERAEATLAVYAGVAEHLGLYGASFGQALRRLMEPAMQVCVIGSDALAAEMEAVATRPFLLNRSVVRLRPEQMGGLPPVLAATLPGVPEWERGSVAVVCRGLSCLPPARTVEELEALLEAKGIWGMGYTPGT